MEKYPEDQWEQLILGPLRSLGNPERYLVVIDGLYECVTDREGDELATPSMQGSLPRVVHTIEARRLQDVFATTTIRQNFIDYIR